MNIQKEVKISGYQPTMFIADTESAELYKAMDTVLAGFDRNHCPVFAASLFYNLGRGCMEYVKRRARRKK